MSNFQIAYFIMKHLPLLKILIPNSCTVNTAETSITTITKGRVLLMLKDLIHCYTERHHMTSIFSLNYVLQKQKVLISHATKLALFRK